MSKLTKTSKIITSHTMYLACTEYVFPRTQLAHQPLGKVHSEDLPGEIYLTWNQNR